MISREGGSPTPTQATCTSSFAPDPSTGKEALRRRRHSPRCLLALIAPLTAAVLRQSRLDQSLRWIDGSVQVKGSRWQREIGLPARRARAVVPPRQVAGRRSPAAPLGATTPLALPGRPSRGADDCRRCCLPSRSGERPVKRAGMSWLRTAAIMLATFATSGARRLFFSFLQALAVAARLVHWAARRCLHRTVRAGGARAPCAGARASCGMTTAAGCRAADRSGAPGEVCPERVPPARRTSVLAPLFVVAMMCAFLPNRFSFVQAIAMIGTFLVHVKTFWCSK